MIVVTHVAASGRDDHHPGNIRTVPEVTITTANDSEQEQRVAVLLADLLRKYDTERWHFTHEVVIDEYATPHSHPVLTLTTRVMGRSLTGLMTSFLHEQLHWYLGDRKASTFSAIDDVKKLFPTVPSRDEGGARNDQSTCLHLILNWLELESLRLVVGAEEADALLRDAGSGSVYPWIYRQVFDRYDDIKAVIERHALDDILVAAH